MIPTLMKANKSSTHQQCLGGPATGDEAHPAADYAEAFFNATGLDLGFVREGREEDFLRSIHSDYCKAMTHNAEELEMCYRFFQSLCELARNAGVEKLVSMSCPFGRSCSAALLSNESGQRSYLVFGRSLIKGHGLQVGLAGDSPMISLEVYQAAMRIISFSMPLLRRRLRDEYRIPSSQLSRLVAEARDFVEAHFRERIAVSDVAAHAGVGANYLSLQYRKEIGITPHADIARKRLHFAEDLLRETSKSITEICVESGHGSFSQFNRLFRACYGVSPVEYRAHLAALSS